MLYTESCRESSIAIEPEPADMLHRAKHDVLVLRYMMQKVRVTLHSLEASTPSEQPLMYNLAIGRRRSQRIALYRPEALLASGPLAFVGFVSSRQKAVVEHIDSELLRVDAHLTKTLMHVPGLLGYSSLELRPGSWYNLVLLRDLEIKEHLKGDAMHHYAAHQLAPHYYEWIRLHSGIVPSGLAGNAMTLQSTKYYYVCEQRLQMRQYSYS